MTIRKTLLPIVLGGVLLTGCGDGKPEIKECRDLTGDGIPDVLMHEDAFDADIRGNYLFIGLKDSTFVRSQETEDSRNGVKYFVTDNGIVYFFNGKFYEESPKQ